MRERVDVAVIGAGPAGSATAALLAGTGATVVLLDRATFPRPKPCAEYLNPDAVARLRRLGVALGGAAVRHMRVVAPSGAAFADAVRDGRAMPRELLDLALLERATARGARPMLGAALRHLEPTPRGWLVHTRSGTLAADLVIGADGMHSRVARQTVGTRPPASRRMALVTHYAGLPGPPDTAEMHVTPFGYVGLAPVGGDMHNVSVVVEPGREPPRGDATAWFTALLASVPSLAARLARGRRVERVRGVGPFGRRARRAHGRRLLLVGDAADFFDPFTGDGIWAALAGAELAAAHAATPDRLDGYARARRRVLGGKWVVDRLVSAAVARPRLFDRLARRLAARPDLAATLLGVTGHTVPSSRALRPGFLLALAR